MRRLFVLFFIAAVTFHLMAERTVGEGNSYSEFSFVVFVGQVVEVTPFSVTVENTAYETGASNERINQLYNILNAEPDFRSHGLANALRCASVKDGKMRLTFYADNIFRIFDDNVTTYMRYIPLYYLFRNNLQDLKLPEKTMESLKKHTLDYYLSIPMAQELMHNSWLAGVFTVNPENDKLIYKSARFFENIEEMNLSDWANEYRIPDIVKSGLAVTMTKAIFIGHESENHPKDEDEDSSNGRKGGRNQFDKGRKTPTGRER